MISLVLYHTANSMRQSRLWLVLGKNKRRGQTKHHTVRCPGELTLLQNDERGQGQSWRCIQKRTGALRGYLWHPAVAYTLNSAREFVVTVYTIICWSSAYYHAWICHVFDKQPFIFNYPAQMTNGAASGAASVRPGPLSFTQWRARGRAWRHPGAETSVDYWEAPPRHWRLAPHIWHSKNLRAKAASLFCTGYIFSLPPTPF